MKALILAAGLGTRLRPLTFIRAKASLPLLSVPFVRYSLQYLHLHQVEEIVINLHAHPDTVRKAAGTSYRGIPIHYSHEPEILGTAGAIRKALPMLNAEPFVVMNSDMLMYIPLAEAFEQHRREGSDVTLVIMREDRFSHYSSLFFEEFESGPPRFVGLQPGKGQRYHYTGLQIVNPDVAKLIPSDRKTEIFGEIYPNLLQDKKIHGFVYDGFWMEIGTLKEYLQTSLDLHLQSLPVALQPPGVEPSLISPEAKVEQGAQVTNSIIMEGAVVRSGADVERCIIGWDVTVTRRIRNAVIVRGVLPWYILNERQLHEERL